MVRVCPLAYDPLPVAGRQRYVGVSPRAKVPLMTYVGKLPKAPGEFLHRRTDSQSRSRRHPTQPLQGGSLVMGSAAAASSHQEFNREDAWADFIVNGGRYVRLRRDICGRYAAGRLRWCDYPLDTGPSHGFTRWRFFGVALP